MLYRWQADFSKGVYDLIMEVDQLTRPIVYGRDTQGETYEVEHASHQDSAWMAALEVTRGGGLYHIEQQPSADNDWTLVIRVDDEWTPYGNSTEVIVWEVPIQ